VADASQSGQLPSFTDTQMELLLGICTSSVAAVNENLMREENVLRRPGKRLRTGTSTNSSSQSGMAPTTPVPPLNPYAQGQSSPNSMPPPPTTPVSRLNPYAQGQASPNSMPPRPTLRGLSYTRPDTYGASGAEGMGVGNSSTLFPTDTENEAAEMLAANTAQPELYQQGTLDPSTLGMPYSGYTGDGDGGSLDDFFS
jgi:hypothetical protein